MEGVNGRSRRLVQVTQGNLRNSTIYVREHLDFFPPDCLGPARRSRNGNNRGVEIDLAGLDKMMKTDLGTSAKTGKPRGFLRDRKFVREFFKYHSVRSGDTLALERLGERKYRLSLLRRATAKGKSFTAAEFFSGIGLVRLALEHHDWEVVFANDIDADKAEMYRDNWPNDDHLLVRDIHKLDPDEIPTCDLFTASFPCNDLSIAGRWEGLSGRESSSYWGFVRILRDMGERRPPLVLLENVVGFLMSHGGRDFEKALLALNELGYSVDAFILNAVHWAPQSRARLFVVAQIDAHDDRHSNAIQSTIRPAALTEFINLNQHVRWDIRKLPRLPKPRHKLKDILEDLPPDDPHWWNRERAEYFMSQFSERHGVEAKKMLRSRVYHYATAFRRVRKGKSMAELRTDGIAGCLRTPRGGSGRQILLKAGRAKYQVRLLTARECARLQGVPDSYKINVPLNQALFGFGDAVCVPAIEWIAKNYLSKLALSFRSGARAGC